MRLCYQYLSRLHLNYSNCQSTDYRRRRRRSVAFAFCRPHGFHYYNLHLYFQYRHQGRIHHLNDLSCECLVAIPCYCCCCLCGRWEGRRLRRRRGRIPIRLNRCHRCRALMRHGSERSIRFPIRFVLFQVM